MTSIPSSPAHQRATIGFLTANIHLGSGRALWPGVADAAEQHDLNYICLPGGGLRVTKVEINSFNPADFVDHAPGNPAINARSPQKIFPPSTVGEPTFQIESITIHLEDFPPRAAG